MDKAIRNILITGGTRGLGLEYARFLASRGYNIGLTDISDKACQVYGEAESVQGIIKELKSYNVDAWFKPANLIDPIETDKLLNSYIDHFGEIHAVITNAGGDIAGDDPNAAGGKAKNNSFFIKYEEYNNIFKRNFDTCFNTLRSVMPYLVDQGFGKVITVSSINAALGVEKETTYSIAKAAILQLTRSLATEVRKNGVNVNCIMPGPVRTERFNATLKGRNSHDLKFLETKGNLERVAEPRDVSSVVEFLLSPKSDFISGEVIKIDGGLFNQSI
jgi:NAD(P)-dependent dehydrogenase (short-subunit alcohol dehydrogenase family)